jgi:cell division topological specificity factor
LLELIARVFGRESASANVAKERLRLVLVHDRTNVSPQFLEAIKEELLEVISRYMEVDQAQVDVSLQSGENQATLVANIPVRRMKRAAVGSGNR